MITSQNAANKAAYTMLFDKALKALKEKKPDVYGELEAITSLEQYFGCIGDLYNIDKRYIMLPLDEEPFEIDANKRTITVPSNFKSHGISVQGDEIAETLFFRIDRFFDAMDLNTCDIYVQWETKNGMPYVTPISIIDIESQPGKILFAWPITSLITKEAGPVKFSARFVKRSGSSGIVYSFSTLTATANISASLNYNIYDVQQDDPSDLFQSAIKNSTSPVTTPAAIPYFVLDLDANVNYYLQDDNKDGTYEKTLKVLANAEDTGMLVYEWYHSQKAGAAGYTMDADSWTDFYELVDQENESFDSTMVYYKKADEANGYELYDMSLGAFDPEVPAYKRYNVCTIVGNTPVEFVYNNEGSVVPVDQTAAKNSLSGEYYAMVTNRVGKPPEFKEAKIESAVVTFPSVSILKIADLNNGIVGKATLTANAETDENAILNYSWEQAITQDGSYSKKATTKTYAPADPGFYRVKMTSMVNLDRLTAYSNTVKVTNEPAIPAFAPEEQAGQADRPINLNEFTETEIKLEASVTLLPELPTELQTEGIEYAWYDENGRVVSNTSTLKIDGTLLNKEIYCQAVNVLNGHKSEPSKSRTYIFFGKEAE